MNIFSCPIIYKWHQNIFLLGNGTNTNMNNIWGPFYSNIIIFKYSYSSLPGRLIQALQPVLNKGIVRNKIKNMPIICKVWGLWYQIWCVFQRRIPLYCWKKNWTKRWCIYIYFFYFFLAFSVKANLQKPSEVFSLTFCNFRFFLAHLSIYYFWLFFR